MFDLYGISGSASFSVKQMLFVSSYNFQYYVNIPTIVGYNVFDRKQNRTHCLSILLSENIITPAVVQ